MPDDIFQQTVDITSDEVYIFPTSYAQRRLWFLDQFDRGSPYYNIPTAIRITGPLDVQVLEDALNEIVARHEALRTVFIAKDGEPYQVVYPEMRVRVPVVDLRHLPPEQREDEAMRLAREEARKPFDLAAGPLFRVLIIQLDDQDFIAVLNLHHIIADGWSMAVLVREIAVLYDAFSKGQPSPLPELEIQYGDFAEWQREYLQGEVLEEQLSYWKQALDDLPPVLELPTDHPRPAVFSSRGASWSFRIPKDLVDAVKRLAQRESATPFMAFLAAFETLLYRYSGQETIAVGTPVANRTQAEIEPLIGVFINTLVIRADFDPAMNFRALLRQTRERALGAYAHQDLPFEMLVDAIQPERDMSHTPLFQVMFIMQNMPLQGSGQQVSDIHMRVLELDAGTATFDITYSLAEQATGMHVSVEYSTDLFELPTIQRMARHYITLLKAIVENPDAPVATLNMLTPEERHTILAQWNDTATPDRRHATVHELFMQVAARQPDAIAVRYEGQSLTYGELDARSNQLAHFLREQGVGPETLVGVMMDKSLDLIVALLGILKAGAAYVPISPDYPPERIRYMLEDSGARLVLVDRAYEVFSVQYSVFSDQEPKLNTENSPAHTQTNSASTPSPQPQIFDLSGLNTEHYPTTPPPLTLSPDNLVYVIYTSGSTGRPKGVMLSHRSLVNSYKGWEEAYGLLDDARSHLQMANFSFDVFSGDLVRALLSGGKLVLVPRDYLLSPPDLYRLMVDEEITIAEFVPAVLRNLVGWLEKNGGDLAFMRVLICASDAWYAGEYRNFLRFCGPDTRLINSFGLTEAAVDSTYFESESLELASDQVVPIGKPFPNNRIYILDDALNLVPVGVKGELYVAGLGLARGYLNRPDLTAERFLPDPYLREVDKTGDVEADFVSPPPGGDERGPRMYKTGDLARWLPSGDIEFIGRKDYQVKVRGFRIEPGEIESVLSQHPLIKICAVDARQAPGRGKELVAWFTPVEGIEPPAVSELRRFMQERLPDYMVPGHFVAVETMPLTPNGKINRRALPDPDWTQRVAEAEFIAPRTPVEEILAGIWRDVLRIEQVSVLDNFFELGGHSLLATQLVSRIEEAFDIDAPLRVVFESPTIAAQAEFVEIEKRAAAGLRPPPIEALPRTGDDRFPLSFAQQRLWFLDQLQPNSPFYNIPESVRVTGPLDVDALIRAFRQVVQRHESLRTVFEMADGEPVQHILPDLHIDIPVIDLTGLSEAEREAEVRRLAYEEAQTPFDLARGPLLRVKLLRLGQREHVILFTLHHIISDNWSSNILITEVAVLYDALLKGQPARLPDLPIQYADFAVWQRNWLQGEVLERQLDFWRQQLQGAPPLLELPTDRPRPPVQTFRGDYLTFHLPDDIGPAIADLARREGATLFMALLAAFDVLLYRYAHQDDISVGTPISGRTHRATENLIGFFVNTLVLRADLSGEPSFRELLARIRDVALDAYAHQDVPFEMVVEAVQPERSLSQSPLFQVMFTLQNVATEAQVVSDLRIKPVDAHSGTAKFDLTLFMQEQDGRLSGALEFNTDLFDRETIERVAGHFGELLKAIAADPDMSIARLPLLTEAERQLLLVEWNQTDAPFPAHLTAPDLFEAQAAATPDAPAVLFRDQTLTYGELNARANRLAHFLQAQGVGPDDIVAILLPRTPEAVIALLGILKAGAAYLPIDPTYPPERIRFMLEDSGARIVIADRPEGQNVKDQRSEVRNRPPDFLTLDIGHWTLDAHPATNPVRTTTPENLAYVIYTSGSTGRPKGVMVHHRGVVNYLTWVQQRYPVREGQGSPVHSSLSFDLTVTSLLGPLVTGGRVRLIPEDAGIEGLTEALRDEGDYSLVKITPAHLELISRSLTPEESARAAHAFIIGGEALLGEHIAFWQRHAPHTALINEYGPTETVVGCAVYQAPPDRDFPGPVPIGKPIINTRLYVLDQHLNPVPIGVPGELYIGGVGVAHGYLNRPDLTAERFLPDPYLREVDKTGDVEADFVSPPPGGDGRGPRMYKTGDLVRWLPDGNLEYLGRTDYQVKIRGYRVELGEIEAVLSQHPLVKEAAAIARPDASGANRLIGYVVPASEELSVGDLRAFMSDLLPDYMVPSAFVLLDEMPLTPNGKIDRRALPEPELAREDLATAFVAPRTETEQAVAAIFADLLGVDRVGAEDDFFELGGHSLLATQVISRIRDDLGADLPLRLIFEQPTVAGLAAAVEEELARPDRLDIPPIRPAPRDGPLPLSFAQQRLWFLDQLEPGQPFYNMPLAVRLRGPLDARGLAYALRSILQRHEVLRTVYREENGQPYQVILDDFDFDLAVDDLSGLDEATREAEARRRAASEALKSFDLAHDLMLRAQLLRLDEDDHILLVTMHHIASDGWSMGILVRELTLLYDAYRRQQPAPLPPLPIQYADFAAWQRNWLQGEVLERELTYWREKLADAPPLLELPTDRPRPPVQTYHGAAVYFNLPDDLLPRLETLAQAENATPFMTLLAAFKVLLARYARTDDISVGTTVAGRDRAEIENLIGFFVNTLVLRTDLSGRPTFRDLLARVRETALGAYDHQHLPFEMLVDELQPQRDMSHSPLFQVMFTYNTSEPLSPAQTGELSLEPVNADETAARFDLTLSLIHAPEGVSAALEYNTDLFDRETIERMAGHFRTLLAAAVEQPDTPVTRLPMLTPAEAETLARWSYAPRDWPLHQTVVDLFEAQVEARPDAVALRFAGEEPVELTYAELDARANQLAHRLMELGVGPETPVAIMVERSPEQVIGLLGILKAGGAYLPIDPSYPPERVRYMLEDARVRVVLVDGEYEVFSVQYSVFSDQETELPTEHSSVHAQADSAFPPMPAYQIIDLTKLNTENSPTENPTPSLLPDNLAYVIYTSGSTGRPKGVMLQHRGLTNLVFAQIEGFGLEPGMRELQFASFSFDASVSETFTALCSGATLVLAPRERLLSGQALVRLLREERINVVTLPPSLLAVLEEADLPDLVTLVSAGEACPWEVADAWAEGRRFLNAYGPTEATVGPTYGVVNEYESRRGATVPIGRPIGNALVAIVDEELQPAPVGVPGEIVIGGVAVARGYLARPALTAEKFVPNNLREVVSTAFASGQGADHLPEVGGRLYRTGDLARWLPDGTIEYLGRMDAMVKVRGFRVELGEVEAVLASHPGVSAAAARVVGEQIAAYYIPEGEDPGPDALREHLASQLPGYMVPGYLIALDAFPTTPSGKIDRKALPEPDISQLVTGTEFVPPRTPAEELLAAIFADLLGVDRVGALDDFFTLGGHSLLATQLISRIRDAFGVELPLRTLFEKPILADLALAVEEARARASGLEAPPIRPVPREGDLPLSFAQQRLWFLDQLEPGAPAYNLPTAVRLTGHLDIDALQPALDDLVARHESLRTNFVARTGEPAQRIHPHRAIPIQVDDLTGLDEDAREAEAQRRAQTEVMRPFDLAADPLVRVKLLRLDEDDHILLVTMHHIISDGWSLGIFVRELTALYLAHARGLPAHLPDLPIQYADFAVWQRNWLQGDVLERQLDYWRQQLAGLPPLLELPTDRPRPAIQTANGDTLAFALPKDLTDRFQQLARAESATPFMAFLAAFQTLLSRYARQTDFAVGAPIAGRNRAELEPLIGFFVNTLVMRADLSDRPTFRELLARVRETALDAYAHQDIPFEMLVDALQPERAMSHAPLFQTVFTLQNTPPVGDLELPDLRIRPVEADITVAKFDLTLALMETPDGFQGSFEYNTDLFDRETIERMAGHFRTLLAAAVEQPDTPVTRLPMLTLAEAETLARWSYAPRDWPLHQTVVDLFEAQVEARPEAVALRFAGEEPVELTYAELNARANQLAHRLIELGVGPETPVAIMVERSPEQVIGLLGILKAGGAYLPIDPSYPPERVRYMLEDSGARIVIGDRPEGQNVRGQRSEVRNRTSDSGPRTPDFLTLDIGHWTLDAAPTTNPIRTTTPENLAYIIYTSGSTGRPKGVMLQHRGLTNLVFAQIEGFGLEPGMRELQFASFSFDASVSETFTALCSGATLVLAPRERLLSGQELVRLLREERINVATLPPSLLAVLERAELPELVTLVSAGEACPWEVADAWAEGRRFLNAYGPTEATVGPTYGVVNEYESRRGATVPIGRPIGNALVAIVDEELQPAPVGVPGEIVIGGVAVARGYLARPALTAEKFVPNNLREVVSTAFASGQGADHLPEVGGRLYRTGDLARWLPDGTIEYLGRMDAMVKVRGFRVELGEVEAVLASHPGVSAAAARVVGEQIAAYYIPEGEDPGAEALREHLASQLPGYMVPGYLIAQDAFPTTPSGKIDRKALPEPDRAARAQTAYLAPRDLLEAQLAGIWEELLDLEQVGMRDDFFALGGHSLLAVRLLARIQEETGVEPSLVDFFQSPTIENLARLVRRALAGESASCLVPLQPLGDRPPLFMIHPSGGSVHWYVDLAQALAPDQPLFGIQAQGLNGDAPIHTTIEAMAAHYVQTIRQAQPQGPYRLGSWSMGVIIAYETARQLMEAGEQVSHLIMLDQGPYQPNDPPEDEAEYLLTFFGKQLPLTLDDLRALPEEDQLPYVFNLAKETGLMLADVSLDQFRRFYDILKTHEMAWRRYEHKPYPGEIILFKAETRPADDHPAEDLGWSDLAQGGVRVIHVPGDHNTMLHPPHLAAFVRKLREALGSGNQ